MMQGLTATPPNGAGCARDARSTSDDERHHAHDETRRALGAPIANEFGPNPARTVSSYRSSFVAREHGGGVDSHRLDLLDRQQWSLEYVATDEPDSGWLVRDFFGDVVTNGHASPRLALDAAIESDLGYTGCGTRAACAEVGCAGRCGRVGA
jgi:hypothetical protein